MDIRDKLGSSFPYGLPDEFAEAYANWESVVSACKDGGVVQKAARKLSVRQLLKLGQLHHFPTLRPELYRFAFKELLTRARSGDLTPEQRLQVGEAWKHVRSYSLNIEESRGPILTPEEIWKLDKMAPASKPTRPQPSAKAE